VEQVLNPKDTLQLTYSVLTENQKKRFETEDELDFSFGIQNLARFRGNCFKQRGCVSMVIRQIPFSVKTFEELGLPPVLAKLAERPRGLVLVTGPTGSGKSTTLAAMIDKINKERKGHIITVEDPIEFIHRHQGCIVNQREIGTDTKSFAAALKYALRQDPDTVLIGEMRDLETIAGRAHHRRDRPPRLRHAAHQLVGRDHQPHHRRVPVAPAVPGPRAARVRARRRRHPDAAPEGVRQGAGHGL
jgi:twitching motility protein PilT